MRALLFETPYKRFFYGWAILAVATIAMFATGPGQSHTFGIFVDLIAADLDISTTSVASSYAFATLIASFGLSRMGRVVDRFGPRKALLGIVTLLGVSCFAFGAVAGVITLSIGFMFLRFLGQGSMMLGSANLIAQWFNARRGVAMSIMMLGFSASVAVHPSLAQWLIETVGWRQAWFWLGGMTWILMLPLIFLFVHDKPEPLGLRPDGVKPDPADSESAAPALTGLTQHQALRTPAFWIIVTCMFMPAMLVTALFFYQVSIFEQHGLSRTLAASVFGVSALSMAIAMPIYGWCLDKVDPKYVLASALLLLAGSLVGITFVYTPAQAMAYAILFGANSAAMMTLFGFLFAHYFGRKHLGSIQGLGQTIGVVGASIGPLPLGVAIDTFGSYDGTLRGLALLPVAAAVLALFLRVPETPATEKED